MTLQLQKSDTNNISYLQEKDEEEDSEEDDDEGDDEEGNQKCIMLGVTCLFIFSGLSMYQAFGPADRPWPFFQGINSCLQVKLHRLVVIGSLTIIY